MRVGGAVFAPAFALPPIAIVAMCSLLRVPSSQVTITSAPPATMAGTWPSSQVSPP